MFSLKHLRLREPSRQPLQKFSQKAPQPTALKPPSTARTAGRSDWAERRFRRQPFILCFNRTGKQGAKASETGHDRERNTHPQRLSSPSPGRYLPGLFPHRTQTPQRSFQGTAAGTHATPAPNRAHSGSQGETGAFWMGALSLPSDRFARFGTSACAAVRRAYFAIFAWTEGTSERSREPSGRRRAPCASPF